MSEIKIQEERLSAEEYIEFLKRTDLGSQYPKERFNERIKKVMLEVSKVRKGLQGAIQTDKILKREKNASRNMDWTNCYRMLTNGIQK